MNSYEFLYNFPPTHPPTTASEHSYGKSELGYGTTELGYGTTKADAGVGIGLKKGESEIWPKQIIN